MELLTVGKVASRVIVNDVAVADAGKVLAGGLGDLHGTNNYVMNNAKGVAQIDAHATGESSDLVATQDATNHFTQSVNGESTRLISSDTLAGAHDSKTGTNFINAALTDNYIRTVGHEMAHAYTQSENIADYMGWATDVIWSTGVWANSAAIAARRPMALNTTLQQQQNMLLLQGNNQDFASAYSDHKDAFNHSLLFDDARALFQVGVNWAASKIDKPLAKGVIKGAGSIVDGGAALLDTVLDTVGSAIYCPLGNVEVCDAAMSANRKRGEAGIQTVKFIASGEAGTEVAGTFWNLNNGSPEEVAEAQEAIAKFSTELGLGAAVAKISLGSKAETVATTSAKTTVPTVATNKVSSLKLNVLPDGSGALEHIPDTPARTVAVVDSSVVTPANAAPNYTALLDDYIYQPSWISFDDYMAQVQNAFDDSLQLYQGAVTNSAERSTASSLSDLDFVQKIATKAESTGVRQGYGAAGTGSAQGTWKHDYANRVLVRYQEMTGQKTDLLPENSYPGGTPARYGTAGSARPDVFNPVTGELFDYKFVKNPGRGLSQRQMDKSAKNVPGVTSQYEINP